MRHYTKTKDGWEFTDPGGRKMTCERIGVVYSLGYAPLPKTVSRFPVKKDPLRRTAQMQKHGELELVQEYLKTTKAKYLAAGLKDIADDLRIVEATHATEEDLNHILESSALPPSHFERLDPHRAKQIQQKLQSGPNLEI